MKFGKAYVNGIERTIYNDNTNGYYYNSKYGRQYIDLYKSRFGENGENGKNSN